MALIVKRRLVRTLSDETVTSWQQIPTSIVADEMNRFGGIASAIGAISTREAFVGEAVTAQIMVGDNLALHWAVNNLPVGSVLVIDAGGFTRTAVWGEVLHTVAERRGAAAVVVDGVIRDRAALRRSPVPIFARGSVPNGPHKGWGGCINGDIHCGGVRVGANDLVIGDSDGIVVVPQDEMLGLLVRCQARMQHEVEMLRKIAAGESSLDLLGLGATAIVSRQGDAPTSSSL